MICRSRWIHEGSNLDITYVITYDYDILPNEENNAHCNSYSR
jgi:hypothetical protein